MTDNPAADILEALGHTDRAALLRWNERPREDEFTDLGAQNAALTEELEELEANLALLESMLCRDCAKEWKAAN